MAFFTGKGDSGTTKLFDSAKGVRESKSSPVFEVLGTLDELNTLIGWCKVAARTTYFGKQGCADLLHDIQDCVFTLQAEVAGAAKSIPEKTVTEVERIIKEIESQLPPVTSFLVPGGTELSARLDMARAVSRRCERRLVALKESGERKIGEHSMQYANRLSSLLYALVRAVNFQSGAAEAPPSYR